MPFKTRRRKESAVERRFTWTQNQSVGYQTTAGLANSTSDDNAKATNVNGAKKITETVNTRADLIKIVLAASVIVTVQVILRLLYK